MVVTVLSFMLGNSAAHASTSDSWGTWQGDAAHTGFVADAFVGSSVRQSWRVAAQTNAIGGLAASSTMVFTTVDPNLQQLSMQQTLVAQDLGDGHPVWTITFPLNTKIGTPAYADGEVFITEHHYSGFSEDAYYIDAFDAASAAPIFQQQIFPPTAYVAPTIANGHVYFVEATSASVEGVFASLSELTGILDWTSDTQDPNGRMPVFVDNQLFGFSTTLNMLASPTGAFRGSIADPNDTSDISGGLTPTVIGSTAYATHGYRLVAFDLPTKSVNWSVDLGATGQISTDGHDLFFLSSGALSVRDAQTGALKWGWEAPQPGIGVTVGVSDNMIVTRTHVILSDSSSTYFINRATRMLDSSYGACGLLAYAGHKVIAADTNGVVTAFSVGSDVVFSDSFE